jgi:uncharacterized protein (TIGR00369 family)
VSELPEADSRLDRGIGLSLLRAEDGEVEMRLEPGELAVVEEGDGAYLHGGALATCVDTAAWYAAESAAPSDGAEWVVAGLSFEGLRLARPEPHLVRARCVRAGRTRAVVDVEIAAESDPERPRAIGRATLGRTPAAG